MKQELYITAYPPESLTLPPQSVENPPINITFIGPGRAPLPLQVAPKLSGDETAPVHKGELVLASTPPRELVPVAPAREVEMRTRKATVPRQPGATEMEQEQETVETGEGGFSTLRRIIRTTLNEVTEHQAEAQYAPWQALKHRLERSKDAPDVSTFQDDNGRKTVDVSWTFNTATRDFEGKALPAARTKVVARTALRSLLGVVPGTTRVDLRGGSAKKMWEDIERVDDGKLIKSPQLLGFEGAEVRKLFRTRYEYNPDAIRDTLGRAALSTADVQVEVEVRRPEEDAASDMPEVMHMATVCHPDKIQPSVLSRMTPRNLLQGALRMFASNGIARAMPDRIGTDQVHHYLEDAMTREYHDRGHQTLYPDVSAAYGDLMRALRYIPTERPDAPQA